MLCPKKLICKSQLGPRKENLLHFKREINDPEELRLWLENKIKSILAAKKVETLTILLVI